MAQRPFVGRSALLDFWRVEANSDQFRDFGAREPPLSGLAGRWQGDEDVFAMQAFTVVIVFCLPTSPSNETRLPRHP